MNWKPPAPSGRINPSPPKAQVQAIPPTTGDRILQGRYRLKEVLGEGGMSTVYLAEDLKLEGKVWAVKEVLPDPVSEEDARVAVESFQGECRLLAGLHHPGIPPIADAFTEDGRGYLIMGRVPGRDLQAILDEDGRWPEDQALRLGLDVCGILRYLHEREPALVFRDLKPSNVMLYDDDGQDRVALIDFGIARHFRSHRRKDTVAIGTLGYAPPEQYSAQIAADARSDLYSLGALLHFVLTGRDPQSNPPFEFPPLRHYLPQVTPTTAAVVEQCLQYDRERRPRSARDVEAALTRALAQWKARQDPSRPTAARRLGFAAGMALALAAGGWLTQGLFAPPPPPPPLIPPPLTAPAAVRLEAGAFVVPIAWHSNGVQYLPPPLGRPLLLFGQETAWAVVTHPGGAGGVGAYGDTVELDADLSRIRALPSLQYWGWPSLVVDESDRLAIADVRGVTRTDGSRHQLLWRRQPIPDTAMEMAAASPIQLFRSGGGRAWAAWPGGFATLDEVERGVHRHLERTDVGYRIARSPASAAPGDWLPREARTFWIDAQGDAWFEDGSLVRLARDGTATRFPALLPPRDGGSVFFASDLRGRTWIGLNGNDSDAALFMIAGDQAQRVAVQARHPRPGESHLVLHQLLAGPQGRILAVTNAGLLQADGSGRAGVLSVPWSGESSDYVGAVAPHGRVYFWGPQGLFRYDGAAWQRGASKAKKPEVRHGRVR